MSILLKNIRSDDRPVEDEVVTLVSWGRPKQEEKEPESIWRSLRFPLLVTALLALFLSSYSSRLFARLVGESPALLLVLKVVVFFLLVQLINTVLKKT